MARKKLYQTTSELIEGYELNNTKYGTRKVSLYGKALPSGKVSLVLYGRSGGKAVRKSTGAILELENDLQTKRANEEKIRLQRIKCDTLNADAERADAGFSPTVKSNASLLLFVDQVAKDEYDRTQNKRSYFYSLQSLAKHITAYASANVTFKEVDLNWCRGFLEYLKSDALDFNYLRSPDPKKRKKLHISQNSQVRLQRNLSYVLNKAVKASLIASNPMQSLDKDEKVKPKDGTRYYLEQSEVQTLIDTPYTHGKHHIKEAFLFSCYTGLRFSDLKQLRRSHFHNDRNGTYLALKMIKTQESLKVYVPQIAIDLLPVADESETDGLIFKLPKNDYANEALHKWLQDAGITDRPITFHCARHTVATVLLSNGLPLAVVGKQLGHRKLATTQVYAKIVEDAQKSAANKIDELFSLQK